MPKPPPSPYGQSVSLLTDLYELTMAYGYWKAGMADLEAVFNLSFRQSPFGGKFALVCGLEPAVDFLCAFGFDGSDLEYLATLEGNDREPLFDESFLEMLGQMRLRVDLNAMPEGTVAFPREPLLRVHGPLVQCQLLESALLNIVGFQTLVATKAARVCLEAGAQPVLEFGLRRAQGLDGGLSASRAAYLGGCSATSNMLAGKLYGIPVRGTHAHSWVMCFDSELEAFRRYAEALPNNSVFLVDTYDTRQGIRRAIEIGKALRNDGHEMVGVRLDSGDLAALSVEARNMLDAAGFDRARVVASSELDEHRIAALKKAGARVDIWGVGTKLVTGFDQPALGAVYKLVAVRRPHEQWQYKVKVSEEPDKISDPGILQVRRFERGGRFVGDVMYDIERPLGHRVQMVDSADMTEVRTFSSEHAGRDLLQPMLREGGVVSSRPSLADGRDLAARQLAALPAKVRRRNAPTRYPVGLEKGLHELKCSLVQRARKNAG